MPFATSRFVPYEMKTSLLKFTGYENKNPVGTNSNPLFEGEKRFENLTRLLLMIEELQNELNFPQASMQGRSFRPEESGSGVLAAAPAAAGEEKALATFKLRILFRQNASWQGSLVWVEQGTEAQFRSVLELVTLLDSVLAG